jgi:hypothetical protein
MKVNHYSRNFTSQPLDSLTTPLTTYTAVTDFISNSVLQLKRSLVAGSRNGLDIEEMCFDSWQG